MFNPSYIAQPEGEMFLVEVRKYGLDENTPRWKRWFFRRLYLPFVRLAFKYAHIPAQGTLHPDGSFSWVEAIGIATDEETARSMCEGEFYRYLKLPVNDGLPEQSLQWKPTCYPGSQKPDRYKVKRFPLTAVRRAEVQIAEQINKQVDNLLNAARSG